jgi:hypothetical protein
MAVDMDQVRAALEPEEPNYAAARSLGPDALPHLEKIITSDHPGLAAKAAYLAGLIGTAGSITALERAARSSQSAVRVAAAAAVAHLPAEQSDPLLLQLVDDADAGVQKVALRSAPSTMSDALRARVAARQSGAVPAAGKGAAKRRAPAKGSLPRRRAAKARGRRR